MSNITDWIKNELYPSLFEVMDIALPEFDFKRRGNNWSSSNKLKITGEEGDSVGKVFVYRDSPAYIKDYTRDHSSIIDYVMNRDGVEFIQAVKTLSNAVGIKPPTDPDFDKEAYTSYRDKASILEDCKSYFLYCLEHSKGAEEVRSYLDSRGYSKEEVKDMEIGYIPSQEQLYKHLIETKGHSKSLVEGTVILNQAIGETHRLIIPYKSGGYIKGFIARTIGSDSPKYLNSTGLKRGEGFFNLSAIKGDKDLLIVEGYLDALVCQSRGIDNVVGLGGVNISKDQIQDALKKGAKKFTLCLDSDEAGQGSVKKGIEMLLNEGVNRVYIVTLSGIEGNKIDPDSLMKEEGVDAFKQLLNTAQPYYEYLLQETLRKYGEKEEDKGLTHKDIDSLLDEVVETSIKLSDPIDRDRYKSLFTGLEDIKSMGITEESLSITVDRLTATRDKENQDKELRKLLIEATKLQSKGETGKALEILDKQSKEVRLKDKETEFSNLLKPTTEEDIKRRLSHKPESLRSGYTIEGEELLLPSGAISVLAAPTSHGKTTLLINLALNVCDLYPDKDVYLFSYEEDRDSVISNALNIYLDEELSQNNRRSIKSYLTTGSTEYIRKEAVDRFESQKEHFFKNLIESRRLNIHYSNYDSDTLIDSIRYLHKNTNVGAVFIDYIQLLKLPIGKYKTYSRQEEIKEVCIALKDVSVETGLPIILGAQFNRTVVNQLHLHPTKIGEAGDIERIANLILGFWNNDHKTEGSEGELKEISNKGIDIPDKIYVEILKQRGGRIGISELLDYQGNRGTIKNSLAIDPFK